MTSTWTILALAAHAYFSSHEALHPAPHDRRGRGCAHACDRFSAPGAVLFVSGGGQAADAGGTGGEVRCAPLWEDLDVAAATGNEAALPPIFDLNSAAGRASLAHAQARMAFVQAWAGDVRWLLPEVSVRTPAIRFSGDSFARVTAVVSEAWSYEYVSPGAAREAISAFGLGREHYRTLQHTGDGWKIVQDRFTDPLDQDTRIPGPARPSGPAAVSRTSIPAVARGGYDRAGAVAYANRYCGPAPGCGNRRSYNRRFYDYNGEGGDCTNFISQALSLGGRLRRNPAWTYDRRTGEGTPAWVRSSTLVDYLVGVGLARLLARGSYAQVAGDVAGLSPGDIIAYAENGKIVHLSMVTAFDPMGYGKSVV